MQLIADFDALGMNQNQDRGKSVHQFCEQIHQFSVILRSRMCYELYIV